MDDKITIIEGPPPTFEAVSDGWVLGVNEGSQPYNLAITRLRTFNGQALLERCHRAWRNGNMMNLEYREATGLEAFAPIVAARTVETDDGQVLLLWVRMEMDETEYAMDDDDDSDDFDPDESDDLGDDDIGPEDTDDWDDYKNKPL